MCRCTTYISCKSSYLIVLLRKYAKGDTMRKMFSLTAALLLSSACMFGQAAAQAGSSDSSKANSNANEVTIEGCLSGSAGNYTLTDSSGMSYQLQGETSKLSDQEIGRA